MNANNLCVPSSRNIFPTSVTRRRFFPFSLGHGVCAAGMLSFGAVANSETDTLLNANLLNKVWLKLEAPWTQPQHESEPQSTWRVSSNVSRSHSADRLAHWTKQTLQLVVKYQQNPLRASRVLAYVHVGLNDAWTLAASSNQSRETSVLYLHCAEIAAHRAACLLLEHFYPNETSGQFAAQFSAIESIGETLPAPLKKWAHDAGGVVAQNLISRSLRDGAGRAWPVKNRPEAFPGIWQAAFPLYAVNPTEGFAGNWRPWVEPNPLRYIPPTVPRPGTPQYKKETEEVFLVSKNLTNSQKSSADRWHLEAGSVTPAGVWVGICLEQLRKNRLLADGLANHDETALALSVLSTVCVAMHDAFIACWKIKFRDWSERPITAIRRTLDNNFAPLLVTPGFPSYVSGHATISAAGASVLAGFWPEQEQVFKALAQDAADSRLWGGIHFRIDNEEGLKLGTSVGKDVLSARALS